MKIEYLQNVFPFNDFSHAHTHPIGKSFAKFSEISLNVACKTMAHYFSHYMKFHRTKMNERRIKRERDTQKKPEKEKHFS